jgi:hypothetical protein
MSLFGRRASPSVVPGLQFRMPAQWDAMMANRAVQQGVTPLAVSHGEVLFSFRWSDYEPLMAPTAGELTGTHAVKFRTVGEIAWVYGVFEITDVGDASGLLKLEPPREMEFAFFQGVNINTGEAFHGFRVDDQTIGFCNLDGSDLYAVGVFHFSGTFNLKTAESNE